MGAALACPQRKAIALEGDGSAMYTLQALWTMARESLDVTIVVFANHAYRILRGEFADVGAGAPGWRATDMLTLDRPALDWCALARGHGVEAPRGGRPGRLRARTAPRPGPRGPLPDRTADAEWFLMQSVCAPESRRWGPRRPGRRICRKFETKCIRPHGTPSGCQPLPRRRVIMLRRDNLSALEV